jgi:TolA-binding protein
VPAPPAAPLAKLEKAPDLTPKKWLERIEELRKQGKLDEARASLAEFKKRYPDYRLPDSLRDGIKP